MRIPDNRGDHGGALFTALLSALLCVGSVGLAWADVNPNEGTHEIMIGLAILSLLMTVNMTLACTRDYWVDETGVCVRILGGRFVRRRLRTEDIRYFGAFLVVSGKFEKTQIVFSKYRPRGNGPGFAIRLRGTIAIDYTPERYEAIRRVFRPGAQTRVVCSRRK